MFFELKDALLKASFYFFMHKNSKQGPIAVM